MTTANDEPRSQPLRPWLITLAVFLPLWLFRAIFCTYAEGPIALSRYFGDFARYPLMFGYQVLLLAVPVFAVVFGGALARRVGAMLVAFIVLSTPVFLAFAGKPGFERVYVQWIAFFNIALLFAYLWLSVRRGATWLLAITALQAIQVAAFIAAVVDPRISYYANFVMVMILDVPQLATIAGAAWWTSPYRRDAHLGQPVTAA